MPLVAASVGAAGVLATRWAQQEDRAEEEPQTLSDEVRAKVATPSDVDLRGVDQARV